MCASKADIDIDKFAAEGPQSTLERKFIQEYLESKGYKPEDLSRLPDGEREPSSARKSMRPHKYTFRPSSL
jgi:hypothetical protein